jgi:hypothetical protein
MKKTSESGFATMIVVLALTVVTGIGFMLWRTYGQSQTQQNNQTTPPNNTSNNQNEPTDDELVISAARAYCDSLAQDGQTMDFTVGKIGPNSKSVVYSADKSFAKVNARCVLSGVNGGSMEYVLRKSDTQWNVLYSGIEENPAKAQQFGVPTDFE